MNTFDVAAALTPTDAAQKGGKIDGVAQWHVSGRKDGKPNFKLASLAQEVPVAFEFNGVSHAVMLASPIDLNDFALGFALSEGIIAQPDQLYGVEVQESNAGITLQIDIATAAFAKLKENRRSLTGRTGCGLCGAETLAQVNRVLAPIRTLDPNESPSDNQNHSQGGKLVMYESDAICKAMIALQQRQPLQTYTGMMHAAAWSNVNGELPIVREDVGRHNALDKVIGALALARDQMKNLGFFIITSRASFEMVQKTVAAKVPLLAAVSGATSLAVKAANDANLTLLGFVREQDFVIYSHPNRVG